MGGKTGGPRGVIATRKNEEGAARQETLTSNTSPSLGRGKKRIRVRVTEKKRQKPPIKKGKSQSTLPRKDRGSEKRRLERGKPPRRRSEKSQFYPKKLRRKESRAKGRGRLQ